MYATRRTGGGGVALLLIAAVAWYGLDHHSLSTDWQPAASTVGTSHEMSGTQLAATWGSPGTSQVRVDFLGHMVQFHSGAPASALAAVSAAINARHLNYHLDSVGTLSIRGRTSDPSDLSYHAFGVAIDINPATNPYVASGAPARHDMPAVYVQIFLAHGFTWGGNWSSPKDYMHFEFHGKP